MAHTFDEHAAPNFQAHWRGPSGYALMFYEIDFRTGGASRLCVRSPQGQDHWVEDVYLEIAEPERVVFSGTVQVAGECLPETAGTVTFRRTERSECDGG